MATQVLEFLLVPDASAARRLRRSLAQVSARSGVLVGTWPDLLRRALESYCIAARPCEPEDLEEALRSIDGAFWINSLEAAPDETIKTVRKALVDLISATDPDTVLDAASAARLAERPRKIFSDLTRLARSLDERLPGDLELIRRLLQSSSSDPLQPIRVHRVAGVPHTTRWQDALIEALNRSAATAKSPDSDVASALRACLSPGPCADSESLLGIMQARLFEREQVSAPLDSSAQWVGVRDFYQEAEIAAGMAQKLLAENPRLKPADIGLLVPDSFEYGVALEDAFRLTGLPLSGAATERWQRDLGYEAVFHFLFCRQKPAPAMALAVCLSSRLMPWNAETGAQMAQDVMDGNPSPRLPGDAGPKAEQMRELLLGGDAEPSGLSRALGEFASLLNGGERFALHARRAREAAGLVQAHLGGSRAIDWTAVRRIVNPELIISGQSPFYNLEGVSVWSETHEPWRSVRHLFVFGFAQGHYPQQLRTSPPFSQADLIDLRDKLGLAIDLPFERQVRLRELFRRQLRAASDSVTVLVPHRNPDRSTAGPSDSLVFMRRLIAHPDNGDGLVALLDSATDRQRIRNLALADPSEPIAPRQLQSGHLRFGQNLLALRKDDLGRARPESPSGLESLLVSPLAWLLQSARAEPLEWAPESASPIVVGTLAHGVFERMFRPGGTLPAPNAIRSQVEAELDTVAQQEAPFMRGPQWHVERRGVAMRTAEAAESWSAVLEALQAEVLASEQWLQGTWCGTEIHGKADLILGIGEDTLLIVDYKWSKSDSRRERMEKGFESQISLYREMVQTGGLKPPRDGGPAPHRYEALAAKLRAARWVGIAYFTMRDQVCLSTSQLPATKRVSGWHAVDGDVAENALQIIRARLDEVRSGIVRLNLVTDRIEFPKICGIMPFAMDRSPLIDMFALAAPEKP